jgi:hypothetical protein
MKEKHTADYFPHYVNGSATKYALEAKYGNDGYAFWFKLLELLCSNGTFSLDFNDNAKKQWLMAITHTCEDKAVEMINYLTSLDAIDVELWNTGKIIWCQNLVDNLDIVFKRRVSYPKKPIFNIPLNNPPNIHTIHTDRGMITDGKHIGNNMNTDSKRYDNKKYKKGDVVKL